MSSILKSIVSFINVSASPIFFRAFRSPRLSFYDNLCSLSFLLLLRVLKNFTLKISRIHPSGRSHRNEISHFLTRCLSFPPLRIPSTWINSRCWLARVEEKGFSCLEENVLQTGNYWNDRQVLSSLIYPSSVFAPFPISFALSPFVTMSRS